MQKKEGQACFRCIEHGWTCPLQAPAPRPRIHRHHSASQHSHVPPPNRAPSPSPSAVRYLQVETPRRRAVSMHGDMNPMPPTGYMAPPSVSGSDRYHDGASVAGSGMTFMDPPVGGRVSQYGLPKYPHQPKMDYRRYVLVTKKDCKS